MKREYRIIIDGIEQRGFWLVRDTFDGALDVVKEWKRQGRLPADAKVTIRTIVTIDEEVTL